MSKTTRIILIVLTLALIASGGGYYYYANVYLKAKAPAAPALQTAKARTGNLTITAAGAGNITPAAEVDLAFRSSGVLSKINVKVGDKVKAGQVLAQLDDSVAQIQLAQAELNVQQLTSPAALANAEVAVSNAQTALVTAQWNLEYLLKPDLASYQDAVTAAQRDLNVASSNVQLLNVGAQAQAVNTALNNYNLALSKLQDVAARLGPETEKYAAARVAYENAAANLEAANLTLEIAKTNQQKTLDNTQIALNTAQDNLKNSTSYTPSSPDVIAAQAQLKLAQANLEAAKSLLAELKGEKTNTPTLVNSTLIQLRQAKLSLDAAKLTLANTSLVSPINGTVTAIKADAGEAVGTAPIITIADLDQPMVRFYVEEADLGKVAVGYSVMVTFDALPDTPIKGKVVRVDPALATVDGSPAVQAWAQLDPLKNGTRLVSGMTAAVDVIAGEAKSAVLVPVQALRDLGPGSFAVFILQPDGQLKLTPVTVGLKDFANAEILSGVKAGDVVSTGNVQTK